MDMGEGPKERVLLLHGVGRSAASMQALERVIAAAGFETLNLTYASRTKRLEALVEDVHLAAGPFFGAGVVTHVVCHSMGGLVARGLINKYRPPGLGRVVMLGTPNQGSELADLLGWNPLYRFLFGPAGAQLGVRASAGLQALLGEVDFPLGVIAGDRANRWLGWAVLPKPNDGRVAVARTKIAGMAGHVVLPVTHDSMMRDQRVQKQVVAFLRDQRFLEG
jgi:pimeloyl-ACP methyl ester carboxylesterase